MLFSIQWLRGLAACAVVARHAATAAEKSGWLPTQGINIGHWGVDLFFAISGFIMVYTTSNVYPGYKTMILFWLRRIIRIAPIYWLITIVIVIFSIITPSMTGYKPEFWHIIGSIFFIPLEDARGILSPPLRVGWSLNFEMYFYIVFGIILVAPRHLMHILIIAWAFFSVTIGLIINPSTPLIQMMTSTYIIEFVAGALVATIIQKKNIVISKKISCFLIVAGISGFLLNDLFGGSASKTIIIGLTVATLTGCITLEQSHKFNFNKKIPIYLGEWSYSIYLIHVPVLVVTYKLFGFLPNINNNFIGVIFFFFSIFVSIIAGAACCKHIEQPLTNKFSYYFRNILSPNRSS